LCPSEGVNKLFCSNCPMTLCIYASFDNNNTIKSVLLTCIGRTSAFVKDRIA